MGEPALQRQHRRALVMHVLYIIKQLFVVCIIKQQRAHTARFPESHEKVPSTAKEKQKISRGEISFAVRVRTDVYTKLYLQLYVLLTEIQVLYKKNFLGIFK